MQLTDKSVNGLLDDSYLVFDVGSHQLRRQIIIDSKSPCTIQSVSFPESVREVTYEVGTGELIELLPELELQSDCDEQPTLQMTIDSLLSETLSEEQM